MTERNNTLDNLSPFGFSLLNSTRISRISSDRIHDGGGGIIFSYRLAEGSRRRRRKRHDIPRGISGMLDGGVTEGHVAALLVRFWPPFVTLTFASALRIARGNRARRCKTHSSGSRRLPCEILRQETAIGVESWKNSHRFPT